MVLTRRFFMGAMPSRASTRLSIWIPPNETSNASAVPATPSPDAMPVCEILSSHSEGDVPSPVGGNDCVRSHWSTADPPALVRTWVRRLRLKNVGVIWVQVVDEQIWSKGTSGQADLLPLDSVPHVSELVGIHRSLVVNSTLIGAPTVNREPERWP